MRTISRRRRRRGGHPQAVSLGTDEPKARQANRVYQDTHPSAEPESSPEKNTAEIQEPLCGRCKKLKIPNSRRPAFLKKWYSDNGKTGEDDDDDDEELQPKLPSDHNQYDDDETEKAAIAQDEPEDQSEEAATETGSSEEGHDVAGNFQEAALAANPVTPAVEHTSAFQGTELAALATSTQEKTTTEPERSERTAVTLGTSTETTDAHVDRAGSGQSQNCGLAIRTFF